MDKFTFEPLPREKWKPIKGFDGYFISSYGRIWSNKQKARFMEPHNTGRGYLMIGLYIKNKAYHKLVHRLVAEAFIENPLKLPQVNHKDENKQNNHVNNLEWCTQKYNINYGTGKQRMADSQRGVPKSEEFKRKIREKRKLQDMSCLCKPIWMCDKITHEKIKRFDGISKAAVAVKGEEKYRSMIKNVLHGRAKTGYGYWWCFAND